jgi:phage terminase Nu1 subunit (DNA packaging protein)
MPYLTKKEIADLFKVSPRTINKFMNEGMPHMKTGRVVAPN